MSLCYYYYVQIKRPYFPGPFKLLWRSTYIGLKSNEFRPRGYFINLCQLISQSVFWFHTVKKNKIFPRFSPLQQNKCIRLLRCVCVKIISFWQAQKYLGVQKMFTIQRMSCIRKKDNSSYKKADTSVWLKRMLSAFDGISFFRMYTESYYTKWNILILKTMISLRLL